MIFTQVEWVSETDVEVLSTEERLYELARHAIRTVMHRIDGGNYAPGAIYLEQRLKHTSD